MHISEFDFDLPPELIAQFPAEHRAASRLLYLPANGVLRDAQFADLPQFLRAGDVMVVNDTRVIKARLFGVKDSGGKVEALVERVFDQNNLLAQIRASHPPKPGMKLDFGEGYTVAVIERNGEFYRLRFDGPGTVFDMLERRGMMPLPPYIGRNPELRDEERYQTVYARVAGAVAAPTAGLHFDAALLERLRAMGVRLAHVTLHVGAGTFQPVRVEDVAEHRMHSEWFEVPQQTVDAIAEAQHGGARVIAVGTTSLRALEAAAASGELRAGCGETNIFIVPGYRFRVADRLLTNFHLPRSTLLMLVSAFGGIEAVRRAYRHAIGQRYRFFSYGDAMLIERAGSVGGKVGCPY